MSAKGQTNIIDFHSLTFYITLENCQASEKSISLLTYTQKEKHCEY